MHARGVSTQHQLRIEEESIVISTRWVIRGNVQSIEVMEIIFDFRARLYSKAKLTKEAFNTFDSTSHWVQTTIFDTATGQCHIDGFSR
ncbi:Uncharacterised protein [Vibrio cholerae]|nr:Uncharacterised protein [Vibrio cholerae]